jgi:hypothetical protein
LEQDPVISGTELEFFWGTMPDIQSGLLRLTSIFEAFVNSNLQ